MSEPFRKALQRTPECPPSERLIGVMEHGEQGDRSGFEAHLRSCPYCQTELALYRGFEAGEIRSDEREAVDFIVKRLQFPLKRVPTAVPFRQRFFTPAWMGGAAFAMAAVLLAVGLTSQWRASRDGAPVSDDRTLRATGVTITSPTGDVSETPGIIAWQPVNGASRYTVSLREVDGAIIFHRNITTPQVLLSEEVRTLLKPGKKVLLEVKAENPSGTEIARSGAISIRLNPAANQSH